MYSAGVKPVPSSRVENRRIPMVLVRADGADILRLPSSKGFVGGKKSSLTNQINVNMHISKLLYWSRIKNNKKQLKVRRT